MSDSNQDDPVASVGDRVDVSWPLTDGLFKDMVGVVVKIKRSKKTKHGSTCKYFIQFDNDDEIYETRLIHLKYKVRRTKKRKVNDAGMEDIRFVGVAGVNNTDHSKQTHPGQLVGGLTADSLKYVVAPMVGASELAFRLLCRKYGATIAYTPMMNSERFAVDAAYRSEEFQCVAEDRPIVAHFSANNPQTFLAAAKHVEKHCDAIDLNLGCPQRVAFSGHFGSYLLDDADRELVLSVVKTVADNVTVPVFVKIRLLNTLPETIRLCRQLAAAGAKLIAVHGRYRVNLVGRDGPGARDGAAHLDQIRDIRLAVPEVPIVANGNVITWEDVQNNLQLTGASGIMSAEGLLDNPALFNGGASVPKLQLAREYLDLAARHPVKTKSLVFHIRRMCREELTRYQLLEDCLRAQSVDEMRAVVEQAAEYERSGSFRFDPLKETRLREAQERKKREEGRRREYEARMARKAKREGKPLGFYIEQGAEAPPHEEVLRLKKLPKEESFAQWRLKFPQHCHAFHLDDNKCARERTCSFLHADSRFVEAEGEAYG